MLYYILSKIIQTTTCQPLPSLLVFKYINIYIIEQIYKNVFKTVAACRSIYRKYWRGGGHEPPHILIAALRRKQGIISRRGGAEEYIIIIIQNNITFSYMFCRFIRAFFINSIVKSWTFYFLLKIYLSFAYLFFVF